jgi:DNA-binding transcriptional regulator YdaS (Cro superfamily)
MNLRDFVKPRGNVVRLAEMLAVPPALVSQWTASSGARQVPADRCPAIERATDGAVSCEEMRPDVGWFRLADPEWPWHPKGRPLIDLSTKETA